MPSPYTNIKQLLSKNNMTQEQTQAYVKGCIRGEPPQCAAACPFDVDIKDMLGKAAKTKWSSAYKTYRNSVIFPAIVAELCPNPCREACIIHEQPIEINAIERAVMDNVKKRAADFYAIPPKDKTVAVIGAGVEGLACALLLAQKQYKVTVFDRGEGWGGQIRTHPKFAEFEQDFRDQFAGVSVDFRFGEEIKNSAEFDAAYEAADDGRFISEIVRGKQAAIEIEYYVQTGNYPERINVMAPENLEPQSFNLEFAAEQAADEAKRCEMCDCSACLDACPMLRSYKKEPKRLAVDFFVDAHVNPPLSTHSMTREAYSCTDCKACKAVCPKNIDLGNLFTAYRMMRADNGTVPKAFHDIFLRRMDEFNANGRYIEPSGERKYLFFPGCSVATDLSATSERVYQFLNERYGAGLWQHCCGSPAKWAAMDYDFKLENQFDGVTVIYACPSCAISLKAQFPDLPLVSVYELLEPNAVHGDFMLFHACSARDNESLKNAVQMLLDSSKISESELKCCGYGGQTMIANPKQYKETVTDNLSESELPYLVYCANCRDTFRHQGKECRHILELLFLGDNDVKVKDMLTFSEEARKNMEAQIISEADVWDVINYAEQSCDKLNGGDGVIIASLERPVLTYWAEYRPLSDGKFYVENTYYHRMKFRMDV
jgi:Fe-S oxidoreductase